MTSARRLLAPLLLAGLLAPAAALASGEDVIRDCTDGGLTKTYSAADYAAALRDIPTDVDEYTDCRDVIRRAQLGAAGGGGTGGGTGGAPAGGTGDPAATGGGVTADQVLASATPQERKAVDRLREAGVAPTVRVGEQDVVPTPVTFAHADRLTTLPTSLILALAGIALGAAAALGAFVRGRGLPRRAPA